MHSSGAQPGSEASEASAPDVSILVVSYNTCELTLGCLRSVEEQTTALDYEVLFIDNASADGSFDAVQEEFGSKPAFKLIRSEQNLGFAGANNKLANEARGEYLLLLNPDTVVLDRAVERVVEFARAHPENRIWGGRTWFDDGTLNPTSCWGDFTLWSQLCRYTGLTRLAPRSRLFDPRSYGHWKRDSVREVAIVTGCFFLIEARFWRELGGFDPEFFMYGEEADLCLRARAVGARPLVCPQAQLVHWGGASEPARENKLVRYLEGETRLLRRHWSPARFALNVRLVLGGVLLRAGVSGLLRLLGRRADTQTWRNVWRRRREWL